MDSSAEWTALADRGGLYHVDDSLFVALELACHGVLDTILESKGEGIERVKKENLAWLCNDEEVQFLWNVVVMDNDETAAAVVRHFCKKLLTSGSLPVAKARSESSKRTTRSKRKKC